MSRSKPYRKHFKCSFPPGEKSTCLADTLNGNGSERY